MVTARNASKARRVLDGRLVDFPQERLARPARGWVRAIRDALGMSARELGDRLGVSDEAVLELERSEVAGGARLRSLEKAAAAMDCTFVYGFLPNGSLDGIVRERAAEVVADDLARVRHSMALEDQAVTPGGPEEDELIQRVAETRGLWSR